MYLKIVYTFIATMVYRRKNLWVSGGLTIFVSQRKFIAKIKKKTSNGVRSHCVIYQALSSTSLPIAMKDYLKQLYEPSITLKQLLSLQNFLPSFGRTWIIIIRLCFFIHLFGSDQKLTC